MTEDEWERIIELEYREGEGLARADDVHASENLIGLLWNLCDLPDED
jgi:hypothetical protein